MNLTFLKEWADWTIQTARYPEAGTGSPAEIHYLLLGLCGEAGEVMNAYKKVLRDGASLDFVAGELADVAWYACRLLVVADFSWDIAWEDSLQAWRQQEMLVLLCGISHLSLQVLDWYLQSRRRETLVWAQQVLPCLWAAMERLGRDPQEVLEAKRQELLIRRGIPAVLQGDR